MRDLSWVPKDFSLVSTMRLSVSTRSSSVGEASRKRPAVWSRAKRTAITRNTCGTWRRIDNLEKRTHPLQKILLGEESLGINTIVKGIDVHRLEW